MSKVILGMTMSLDGYINDRAGSVSRLYPDFEAMRETETLQEAIRTTGAVVMGRHAYDMGNGDFTGYEFQTPIFVLTHHVPATAAKGENDQLTFTFVTDGIRSAVEQAKVAAGDKNVVVFGLSSKSGSQIHPPGGSSNEVANLREGWKRDLLPDVRANGMMAA